MRRVEFKPVYLDTIPEILEENVLYISKKYEVAIHLCACGCKGKAVTPLCNGHWTLIEREDKVSLTPSIANWLGQNPYHAHYWITDNIAILEN